MNVSMIVVVLVISAILGYIVLNYINKKEMTVESPSKVLRFFSIFMQYVLYVGSVIIFLAAIAILLNQTRINDFVETLDLKIIASMGFANFDVDVSKFITDNLARIIMVFAPLAIYAMIVSSFIARTSAQIFKILSSGIVFSQEIIDKTKKILIYFIYLFPVNLFTVTLKGQHDLEFGISIEFIALFVFLYMIFAVYKKAFDVHEESKLTI